jgi:hypothetical protein
MKKITYVLIAIIALSFSAFAIDAKMSLVSPGKVNGSELKAGDYKLSWTGKGNVQVNITGNGVKLTVPASIVEGDKSMHDAVVKSSDGSVQEVQFSGKTMKVKFSGTSERPAGQ